MSKIMKREEAQRLYDWLVGHGHSPDEANEAIAFVIGIMKQKKENPSTAR